MDGRRYYLPSTLQSVDINFLKFKSKKWWTNFFNDARETQEFGKLKVFLELILSIKLELALCFVFLLYVRIDF